MADDRPANLVDHVSVGFSTWGNWIRNSTIPVFTSTTARDSAIPSPTAGMACYLATGAATEGLYFYTTGGDWYPDWRTSWGVQGKASRSVNQTVSTTLVDITGSSFTFPQVTNRNYAVTVNFAASNTFAGGNSLGLTLTTSTGVLVATLPSIKLDNTFFTPWSFTLPLVGSSTGSTTWKLQGQAAANGIQLANASVPFSIQIIDNGPDGPPV